MRSTCPRVLGQELRTLIALVGGRCFHQAHTRRARPRRTAIPTAERLELALKLWRCWQDGQTAPPRALQPPHSPCPASSSRSECAAAEGRSGAGRRRAVPLCSPGAAPGRSISEQAESASLQLRGVSTVQDHGKRSAAAGTQLGPQLGALAAEHITSHPSSRTAGGRHPLVFVRRRPLLPDAVSPPPSPVVPWDGDVSAPPSISGSVESLGSFQLPGTIGAASCRRPLAASRVERRSKLAASTLAPWAFDEDDGGPTPRARAPGPSARQLG